MVGDRRATVGEGGSVRSPGYGPAMLIPRRLLSTAAIVKELTPVRCEGRHQTAFVRVGSGS